jgi:YYY domain-containing protein
VLDALLFWLLAVVIGLIGLPFAAAMFARLPGGGLAFARPVGLVVVAYPLWLLASVHLVGYGRAAAIAAIAVAAVVSIPVGLRRLRGLRLGSIPVRLWISSEVLFAVCFVGWTVLRSFSPEIVQTEKPMDMAIVNAVDKSSSFPPHDPWFSGADLNYYYFGHYFAAILIRVLGVDPAIGYNLAVALFFALSTTAVFAAASALYLALQGESGAPAVSAIVPGLAAAGFAVAGNLAGAVRYLEHPGQISTYDWFAPSRVIPNTANEFPFFSFLLGDLHGHLLAVPFALTALAFAMQICLNGPRLGETSGPVSRVAAVGELVLGALLLGVLYAVNGLDYPTGVAIAVLSLILWILAHPQTWITSLIGGTLWIGGSVVLFLPFWTQFSPTTHGLGLVRDRTHFSIFLKDEFLIYGVTLWVLATLFARRRGAPIRYLIWGGIGTVIVLVLLSPPRLASVVLGLVLTAISLFFALGGERAQAERFLWLLVAACVALIGIGEFLYVRDSFDGTPSFRFNTVFKAGYQAWFLLAIVAGCVLFWNRMWLSGWPRRIWKLGVACLVGLALIYPVVASYSRSGGFAQTPTLDGMAWLEAKAPGDAAAIDWLRRNGSASSTVLEAVGPDFDPEGSARVSTFSGIATVLGWAGHEVQWGHDPGPRGTDVQRIYRTPDSAVARRLLDRYAVRYVFVGSLERREFPQASLGKFARMGRLVFSRAGASVYDLAGARP